MAQKLIYRANITPATAPMEVSYDGGTTFVALAFATVGSLQEATLANVPAATYAIGKIVMRAVGYPATTVSNAAALTVLAAAAPTISSFTPVAANTGNGITLTGANLDGASAVKINGLSATYTILSTTSISVTVPAGATTGAITVITAGGTATSASSFTVSDPVAADYAITATTIAKSTKNGRIWVVPVQNSIGVGYPVSSSDLTRIYLAQYVTGLKTQFGASNVSYDNRFSVSGTTVLDMQAAVPNILAFLDTIQASEPRAQVCIPFFEGTNTLWYGTAGANGNKNETDFLGETSTLLGQLIGHASRPVLSIATVMPREGTPFATPSGANDIEYERRRLAANIGIRRNFAAQAEAIVEFAHSKMDAQGADTVRNPVQVLYSTDGIHPVELGHDFMAAQMLAAMPARFNTVVAGGTSPWHNLASGLTITGTDATGLTVEGAAANFGGTAQLNQAIGVPATNSTDITVLWGQVTYEFQTLGDSLAGLLEVGKPIPQDYTALAAAGYVNSTGVARAFKYGANAGDKGPATAPYQIQLKVYYDRVDVFLPSSTVADYSLVRDTHGALAPALNLNGASGMGPRVKLASFSGVNLVASGF